MADSFIAARMQLRGLLTPEALSGANETFIRRALERSKRDLLRRIKAKMTPTALSKRAKKALSAAMKIEIKPSSLVVTVNHPAFGPLVKGQKRKQMRWLLKSKTPIPIITDEGKLIFRNATARSMKRAGGGPNEGKRGWVHPGRPANNFIDVAKKESRDFLKLNLAKGLTQQIRAASKKSGKRR